MGAQGPQSGTDGRHRRCCALVHASSLPPQQGCLPHRRAALSTHQHQPARPYLLVQALAPAMVQRGHGAIINISSGATTTPGPGTGIYGATKAALESLTRVWAAEFGPAGVRVNALAAGPTRTEGTAAFGDAFEAAGKAVALQRLADAEEIAGAVTFLASQAAGYINGTTLSAMGGMPALG
ncbi:SDR family NAD(P)-dependent oxidoreductase [Streptosporangium sp. 'caverna']|uniref:SDR family NAD(P)-dependent oxidoreductase n=1 Tax=Streptosporangium sp. 'caverna' TaxID=2202249 RepID=UPI0035164CFD